MVLLFHAHVCHPSLCAQDIITHVFGHIIRGFAIQKIKLKMPSGREKGELSQPSGDPTVQRVYGTTVSGGV